MKVQITIDCDNEAFRDDAAGEVARILEELALKIDWLDYEKPLTGGTTLYDANGNPVGAFVVSH